MATLTHEPITATIDGPRGRSKAKVLRAQFGDGYSQRAAEGINSVSESWSVSWENMIQEERDTIIEELEAAKGVTTFTWTPIGQSTAKKFSCETWDEQVYHGNVANAYTINATFVREFDLG